MDAQESPFRYHLLNTCHIKMTYPEILEIGANIASIVTALLAGAAFGLYKWDKYQKRIRLEAHLRHGEPGNLGPRPVIYLASELGMTEAEIMDAAFRSNCITREVTQSMIGAPAMILLRYRDKP